MPKQEDIKIFNESERATMIKEYFLSEDVEKWHHFIQLDDANEMERYRKWSDSLLETEDEDMEYSPNITEQSEILCPNASSRDNENDDQKAKKELEVDMKSKDSLLYFEKQALHADLEYERQHNLDCDKGVYRQKASMLDQAKRTGLRADNEDKWNSLMD